MAAEAAKVATEGKEEALFFFLSFLFSFQHSSRLRDLWLLL
jgi:hypothetical protein